MSIPLLHMIVFRTEWRQFLTKKGCLNRSIPEGGNREREEMLAVFPENDSRLKREYTDGFGGPVREEWAHEAVEVSEEQIV